MQLLESLTETVLWHGSDDGWLTFDDEGWNGGDTSSFCLDAPRFHTLGVPTIAQGHSQGSNIQTAVSGNTQEYFHVTYIMTIRKARLETGIMKFMVKAIISRKFGRLQRKPRIAQERHLSKLDTVRSSIMVARHRHLINVELIEYLVHQSPFAGCLRMNLMRHPGVLDVKILSQCVDNARADKTERSDKI